MHFEDLEVNDNECTAHNNELAANGCEHLDQTPVLNQLPLVWTHCLGNKEQNETKTVTEAFHRCVACVLAATNGTTRNRPCWGPGGVRLF